jgi:hypothetical protein
MAASQNQRPTIVSPSQKPPNRTSIAISLHRNGP